MRRSGEERDGVSEDINCVVEQLAACYDADWFIPGDCSLEVFRMCSSATDMLPMTVIVWRPSALHRSTHIWLKTRAQGQMLSVLAGLFRLTRHCNKFHCEISANYRQLDFPASKAVSDLFFWHVTCANSVNSPNIAPQQPTWEGRADSRNQVSQIYFQNFPGSPMILFTVLRSFSFFWFCLYMRESSITPLQLPKTSKQ